MGVRARGGRINGRCQTDECRRHVTIDLQDWIDHGFAEAPIRAVQRLYLCSRLHCGLKFNPEFFPGGVPLQYYAEDERPTVTVECLSCKRSTTIKASIYLKQLLEAGTGDGNTGIHDLSGRIRGPCRSCGEHRWSATFNLNTDTGPKL